MKGTIGWKDRASNIKNGKIDMESWLARQAEDMVQSWEKTVETYYPQYLKVWTDPHRHFEALKKEWNFLDAVEYLNLDEFLNEEENKILDLGAGTGWLSIMLSTRKDVEKIYALDASATSLMLPALAKLMSGNLSKVIPIRGLFTPILVNDGFFDMVVASAAVHHAQDLAECLCEVYRVTKPGGVFLILNETPISSLWYALTTCVRCAKILRTVAFKWWRPISQSVSESGISTNPYLGDRAYCYWQWKAAIEEAGFSFEAIVTPYYTYKNADHYQGTRLTHFIARKLVGDKGT